MDQQKKDSIEELRRKSRKLQEREKEIFKTLTNSFERTDAICQRLELLLKGSSIKTLK